MDTVSVLLCCLVCRRQSRRANLFKEQLERVDSVYPGTIYVCVVDGQGQIVAQIAAHDSTTAHSLRPDELSGVIATLHRSVAQFAATLQQTPESQVVHIKGDKHIFSSFSLLNNHVLAFYTVMQADMVATWNCAEADAKLEPIRSELVRLLAPQAS